MKRLKEPNRETVGKVFGLTKATSLRRAAKMLDLSEVTVASLAAGLDCTPETERHAAGRFDEALNALPHNEQEAVLKAMLDRRRREIGATEN